MRSRAFGRRLIRHLWIPVLLTMVATLTMAVIAHSSTPDYRATATVVAKNPPTGLEKSLNFADIATSNSVALRVKRQLGLRDSVEQLVGRIQVTSTRSNLYAITVSDSDAARAANIANAVAREAGILYTQLGSGAGSPVLADLDRQRTVYQQQHLDAARALAVFDSAHPGLAKAAESGPVDPELVAQRMQLQLEEQATTAAYLKFQDQAAQTRVGALNSQLSFAAFLVDEAVAKPDQTRSILRIAYAGGLALLVGLAIVLVLQLRDRSVRAADEVEEMLGVPVIATIPRATPDTLGSRAS